MCQAWKSLRPDGNSIRCVFGGGGVVVRNRRSRSLSDKSCVDEGQYGGQVTEVVHVRKNNLSVVMIP